MFSRIKRSVSYQGKESRNMDGTMYKIPTTCVQKNMPTTIKIGHPLFYMY